MSRKYPSLSPNINKQARLKNQDGGYEYWTIVDEVREQQNREKVIVLQLLQSDDRRKELRLAYYIIGKKPRMKDKWVWGQFCTMTPSRVFRRIIEKAVGKGWI